VLPLAWSLAWAAISAVAKNPRPGHEVIWRGQAQPITLCEGFVLGKDSRASINCG